MQIHSSSLTFNPVSNKRPVQGLGENAHARADRELNTENQTQQGTDTGARDSISVSGRQERESAQTPPVSSAAENQPTNSRILKALNTYTETIRQPAQDTSSVFNRIDYFV